VITVPAAVVPSVVRAIGPLEGKTIVDVTNAVRFGGPVVETPGTSPLSFAERRKIPVRFRRRGSSRTSRGFG
jgi:predicted dinucleotide-binding enzyme